MKIFSLCSESLLAMLAFTFRYKEKLTHDYVTILLRRRSDSRSPKSDDRTCTNYINLSLYENRHFGETLSMKTRLKSHFSYFRETAPYFLKTLLQNDTIVELLYQSFYQNEFLTIGDRDTNAVAVLNVNISIFTPKTQMKTSHYRKYVSMGK